jgi:hypothetical protein
VTRHNLRFPTASSYEFLPEVLGVVNKSHGSRYVFFFSINSIQIINPIVFSPDDTNTSCSAGDQTRTIIDRDIARLEESIRGLERSIRALNSRRNELSPISRLPAEILRIIFYLSTFRTRRPKSWTNFSQVSQHWRSLALNAPELWTNIPISYPRWAKEMLIRSKKAKLTIRSDPSFDTSTPPTIETIRSCLYEMNRVEEIDISILPAVTLEKIFRDLPKSAPQLHTLCIGSCSFPFSIFSIQEDFLYDTERLRRVELLNCKISWDSRLLTGLTRLTLEVDEEKSSSFKANSSINQILHALQRMPALTDLRLKNSIPDDSEGPSTYPVVDLPCLQILRISSGVGALTTVLHHITFPHSAMLSLTCKESQSTQIDFSNFFSVLATKFLSTLVFRSLSLHVLDDIRNQGLEFRLGTTAVIRDFLPSFSLISQFQLELVLIWPSSQPHNCVRALTCAFDAMSLPFLTQLQISTRDCIDSQTWVKTFGKLPLLEQVYVRGHTTYCFLEALVYKTKEAEKSKTAYRNVTFPKLRYIFLHSTDFGATNGSISVDTLFDYLMERCERNAEVQELCLENCSHISSDEVKRLKEIVVDVTWDGVGSLTDTVLRTFDNSLSAYKVNTNTKTIF